ncbi:bacteriohemerythrin [Sulfurihydrogenibium azorense]|uniref:bacteriohemerythrin n=1 Tax=Sulfurihydrogenibium azorense TaxID=309806 RepID=UPI002409AB72|nr:hemerythrin family protein [Sulfurihydrogenibium azorense]MDM7274005.1 hemerythrin family protein [Sulfurihydrogenibium azorense]
MLISPQEMPKVAVDEMNEVHSTEVEILNKLYEKILEFENDSSKFDEVVKLFDEFLNDVIQHFSFEQNMMEETNFFAYSMHRGEHDRVLFELKSLEKMLKEKNDVKTLKEYLVYNFKLWIINHVKTMDTVTAMYLSNFL